MSSLTRLIAIVLFLALSSAPASAADAIVAVPVQTNADAAVGALKAELKREGFFVIKDLDILANLKKGLAKKLGKDFNRNKLESIRAVVICHGRYANRLANADPRLLALCPLRVSAVQQKGATMLYFERPTAAVPGGPGAPIVAELEKAVVDVMREAAKKAERPTP